MRERFNKAVDACIKALGSPSALVVAASVIAVWAITGPIFGFSDTWQLVINTGTTIVTFLMVFVIQNSQNRDSKAVHIKLDELIRAVEGARDRFALAELESDEDQERDIRELIRVARKTERHSETAAAAAGEATKAAASAKRSTARARGGNSTQPSSRNGSRPTGRTSSRRASPGKTKAA